ncbi:GNAT family N-acetyltransferase [Pontibacter liquoris]|uniref:GNAT family N-acetyltransferase n=1 Tax=Pontibacter liquoris TaxID=2905677 RepID=UPI001FA6C2A6|nr:GNAT family N-acetyltransferase [Pontibacter liquoris]
MIRPYSPNDKEALLALLRLNTPQYFHPAEEQDLSDYLEQYAQDYFVVTEAATLVGSGGINYFEADKVARLSWDIIHPDFQGKGIGRKLTEFRIARISTHPEIDTIVVRTTQLVYGFYQKAGFALTNTAKDFWAPGFDLYQMEMKIKR